MPQRHILVTGATGFVGAALCTRLSKLGYSVRRAIRGPARQLPDDEVVGNMRLTPNWGDALNNIDFVVHLAARTHVLRDTARDPLAEYHQINVAATTTLGHACVKAKVKRIVFLSSIKVNGESTSGRPPFSESDTPVPEDAYGVTKWEAEKTLRKIAADSEMRLVILRAPLVYGPGVKGNFQRLMKITARGLPLPFGSIRNVRSLIYIENLVDAIIASIEAPITNDKTYLVSDGEGTSTPALIRKIASALGVRPRLFPYPPVLLAFGASLLNKADVWRRIGGSLEIDSSRIRSELGWSPKYSLDQGLEKTAQWYYSQFPDKSNT